MISNKSIRPIEREGRLSLLKKIVYYSNVYEWKAILAFYAAWLRRIELGEKEWDDDPAQIEIPILAKHVLNVSKYEKNRNHSYTYRNTVQNERTWFCSQFQKNKCTERSNHEGQVKGVKRYLEHICAACWIRSSVKSGHPECSSACPHSVHSANS